LTRPREPGFRGIDALILASDTVWGLQYTINHSKVLQYQVLIRFVN
jgi:hypothetical protein